VATPAPDRHARRREQKRARLLEAARALFARQGVDNTRINEITDEADDSAELQRMLAEHPFTPFADVEIRPVVDPGTALKTLQEAFAARAQTG
jgi:muconolactone delta-isomerase